MRRTTRYERLGDSVSEFRQASHALSYRKLEAGMHYRNEINTPQRAARNAVHPARKMPIIIDFSG